MENFQQHSYMSNALRNTPYELVTKAPVKMGDTFGPFSRFKLVSSTPTWLGAVDAEIRSSTEPVCFGRTIEELVEAVNQRLIFEAMQNTENWKLPVSAIVRAEDADLAARAVEAFTATKARIIPVHAHTEIVFVTAPGYYAGPAN